MLHVIVIKYSNFEFKLVANRQVDLDFDDFRHQVVDHILNDIRECHPELKRVPTWVYIGVSPREWFFTHKKGLPENAWFKGDFEWFDQLAHLVDLVRKGLEVEQ